MNEVPGWIGLGEFAPAIVARCDLGATISTLTESPIETVFGVAAAEFLMQRYRSEFLICLQKDVPAHSDFRALMIPQYVWQRYRIDWAFRFRDRFQQFVFVECDGAEFHSTPEQIARDKAKDRAAVEAKIPLLRFSGSEIMSAPDYCIMKFRMRVAPNWRMP